MARKTLLTESELHRFMKLASISPLGEKKIQEMGYGNAPPAARDPNDLGEEEEILMGGDEPPVEMPSDEPEMGDELGMDDEPAMEAAPEGDMELTDDEAQAIIVLADKLRAAMGGEEGDAEMELEPEDDLEAPEGGDTEMDTMDAEEEEDPMLEGEEEDQQAAANARKKREDRPRKPGAKPGVKEGDSEDLVAEVARRVAKRLKTDSKKEEIVSQLAERIMQRLSK